MTMNSDVVDTGGKFTEIYIDRGGTGGDVNLPPSSVHVVSGKLLMVERL
jgi:hypothetical protein